MLSDGDRDARGEEGGGKVPFVCVPVSSPKKSKSRIEINKNDYMTYCK